MPAITKDREKAKQLAVTVKKDMQDYGNEPFFVEKAAQAIAFLQKNGLPEQSKK